MATYLTVKAPMENSQKQKSMSNFMIELVGHITKAKNSDQKIDWLSAYAEKFIEVWGEREASELCRAISRDAHGDQMKFCQLVSGKLHDMNKKLRQEGYENE